MRRYFNYLLISIIIIDLVLFVPVTFMFLIDGDWFEVLLCILFIVIPCGLAFHFIAPEHLERTKNEKSLFQKLTEATNQPTGETISFRVKSWGDDLNNISKWQQENARNQWINGKYSKKPLYKYSWMNSENVKLYPEKTNPFDEYAIKVELDRCKIGYVPRPINEEYYKKLLKAKTVTADIHGGDSKFIDEIDDLVIKRDTPIVKVTVSI